MKKTILLLISFFSLYAATAQSDKKGTIVVKKSNCYDIKLQLNTFDKDTLTVSEFNSTFGIVPKIKNCNENHVYTVLSFDITINQQPKIHIVGSEFRNNVKKISEEGIVKITNCFINVSGDELVAGNKKGKNTISDDKKILVDEKIFYIVAN